MAERMTPDKGSPELRVTKLSWQRQGVLQLSRACAEGMDATSRSEILQDTSQFLEPLSHPLIPAHARARRSFEGSWAAVLAKHAARGHWQALQEAGVLPACLQEVHTGAVGTSTRTSSIQPCRCTVGNARLETSSRRDMSWQHGLATCATSIV